MSKLGSIANPAIPHSGTQNGMKQERERENRSEQRVMVMAMVFAIASVYEPA